MPRPPFADDRRLSDRQLRHLLQPFVTAGWTVAGLLWALDHPGRTRAPVLLDHISGAAEPGRLAGLAARHVGWRRRRVRADPAAAPRSHRTTARRVGAGVNRDRATRRMNVRPVADLQGAPRRCAAGSDVAGRCRRWVSDRICGPPGTPPGSSARGRSVRTAGGHRRTARYHRGDRPPGPRPLHEVQRVEGGGARRGVPACSVGCVGDISRGRVRTAVVDECL